jgi:hypothetical protein
MRDSSRAALATLLLVACNQSSTPPPAPESAADCAKVAEIVTNYELGAGAKADARTAAVARHREACKTAGLTVADANCIAKAKGTWDLMACAPKMFPQRATGGDCKAVAAKMRDSIVADLPKDMGSAGLAMVDKMIVVIEQSCSDDNWPAEFRTCILDAKPEELVGTSKKRKCDDMLPHEMQLKMGERLKPIIIRDMPPSDGKAPEPAKPSP